MTIASAQAKARAYLDLAAQIDTIEQQRADLLASLCVANDELAVALRGTKFGLPLFGGRPIHLARTRGQVHAAASQALAALLEA